jgi:chromosome segregation ATPase
MDLDQLKNRIEWLDDERRKDKATIAELQKKLSKIEGNQDKAAKQSKDLNIEITRLGVLVAKIDKFDLALNKQNTENKKALDNHEKRLKRRETEYKKNMKNDIEDISRTVLEVKEELKSQDKLREEIKTQKENEVRFNRLFADTEDMNKEFKDGEAVRNHTVRSLESERTKDTKRMADIEGEVSGIRKRFEEQRAKIDMTLESQKKIENRLSQLIIAETERLENQREFLEKVRLDQTDKNKTWSEWNLRFDNQTMELEKYLKEFSESELAVRKAQDAFNDITEQIGRRIHEITEIQRLGEERFRQEWATFKSDDQKRWANYNLTQDEQFREANRNLTSLGDQTANLEDNFQEIQDIVQHITEQSETRLQSLLASIREWVSEDERFSNSLR